MVGGTGAAGALSALVAACGGSASKSRTSSSTAATQVSNSGDVKIVNYALTLEYIETAFYAKVAASGLFRGGGLAEIRLIARQEAQHVAALTATVAKLGGTPAPRPRTTFPIDNPRQALAPALSIHSVEARHAAAVNKLAGKSPHTRRRVREAGVHGPGPGGGQAVHRRLTGHKRERKEARTMPSRSQPAAPGLAGVAVHGMTHTTFILRGTLAAGSLYGLGAVMPCVGEALAQSGGGDIGIVNYALTLEYLETAF